MPADAVISRPGAAAIPLDYQVPTGTEIVPRTISANFNGAAAAGAYVPVLEVIAPGGAVTAYCARRTPIAAGASALVSWFPGVEADPTAADIGALTQAITSLASPTASIAVGQPTGPATTVDLPNSGAVAGSYGDASHSAEVTVNAEGIVTSIAQVGIAGGASTIGFEIGYDQITANVTVSSTIESAGTTVISCAPHTFDGAAVLVEFFFNIQNGTNSPVTVSLFEGSTQITRLCEFIPPTTGNLGMMMSGWYRFTPTAASHTYTVTAFHSGVNNGGIVAGNGGTGGEPPAFIRFTKV